jgi:hypothetical protein
MVDSISYDLSKKIVSILGCVPKNIETSNYSMYDACKIGCLNFLIYTFTLYCICYCPVISPNLEAT